MKQSNGNVKENEMKRREKLEKDFFFFAEAKLNIIEML
jgi:hypothetical protein